MTSSLILVATALALAGCSGGGEAGNRGNAVVVEEQGDLNMALGGDEITPVPEDDDPTGANVADNASAPPSNNI